jgi:hypothetical protein
MKSSLVVPFSEKYSTIADQVAAAASASIELQAQNAKAIPFASPRHSLLRPVA